MWVAIAVLRLHDRFLVCPPLSLSSRPFVRGIPLRSHQPKESESHTQPTSVHHLDKGTESGLANWAHIPGPNDVMPDHAGRYDTWKDSKRTHFRCSQSGWRPTVVSPSDADNPGDAKRLTMLLLSSVWSTPFPSTWPICNLIGILDYGNETSLVPGMWAQFARPLSASFSKWRTEVGWVRD